MSTTKLPWEIRAINVFAVLFLVAGAIWLFLCAAGSINLISPSHVPKSDYVWNSIMVPLIVAANCFLAGLMLRAVSGCWQCLERVAGHHVS